MAALKKGKQNEILKNEGNSDRAKHVIFIKNQKHLIIWKNDMISALISLIVMKLVYEIYILFQCRPLSYKRILIMCCSIATEHDFL